MISEEHRAPIGRDIALVGKTKHRLTSEEHRAPLGRYIALDGPCHRIRWEDQLIGDWIMMEGCHWLK
eukprot:9665651-Heterocapsa_arctica.AAC.1